MFSLRRLALLPLFSAPCLCFAATAPAVEPPGIDPARVEQARAVANELSSALAMRLVSEMQRGGPAAAVKVCAEVAPALAESHSKDGVTVRRVSLKFRNPSNAPDAYEAAQLERLATLHAEKKSPAEVVDVVTAGDRRVLRFMRPIAVADRCLACHGPVEGLSPEVRRLLAEKYPRDRATGFATGDFRGAVSVVIQLD